MIDVREREAFFRTLQDWSNNMGGSFETTFNLEEMWGSGWSFGVDLQNALWGRTESVGKGRVEAMSSILGRKKSEAGSGGWWKKIKLEVQRWNSTKDKVARIWDFESEMWDYM